MERATERYAAVSPRAFVGVCVFSRVLMFSSVVNTKMEVFLQLRDWDYNKPIFVLHDSEDRNLPQFFYRRDIQGQVRGTNNVGTYLNMHSL